MEPMNDDLETLADEGVELEIAGKKLHLRPLRVRQIPAVSRALAPLASADMDWKSDDPVTWLPLLAMGDHLIEAVAAATDQPMEWVGELQPVEFTRLLAACLEVNGDFFRRQVEPTLDTVNGLMDKIGMAGPESPSASASPQES